MALPHFLNIFFNFLFPKTGRVLALEKLSAANLLEILPPANLPETDTLALFDYSHPVVKEIVWEVKYAGNRQLAARLGEILHDVVVDELQNRNIFAEWQTVILMPMPISDKRRFERGWNQSELLASAIKICDNARRFKYLPRQLAKIRHTESQTKTASKKERTGNLNQSMKVLNFLSVRDRCVVVIDDVVTTGSTFTEAKRALKEAGAKKVVCIAVAH